MAGTIVRAAIHPAIGIARVGSSRSDYLLAPQVPFPPPRPVDSSHDATGQLKREAVEFRIYGYDVDGNAVELTADNAEIVWTVHVANAKAAWYKFRHAMDLDALRGTVVERRNPTVVTSAERRRLVIDPGPRSISGRDQGGQPEHRFDTGTFKDTPVYLGELRTTAQGRMLFLPGHGVSASPSGASPVVVSDTDWFGNAADWYDDIADGPVDATVVVNGVSIPVEGAWVASAPPSYAPDLKSWRTLYDVLVDLYVASGWLPRRPRVSFTHDIYPVLDRLSGLQWVNKAFSAVFGHNAPFDFRNPELIDRISRIHGGPAADTYRPLRFAILSVFREQTGLPSDPAAWPWLYGDSYGSTDPDTNPYQYLALRGERLRYLQEWLKGEFEADWSRVPAPPSQIDRYPLGEQPAALDRAALDFCAADALHPGIELTWPMRNLALYTKPFRIARATAPEPDYGPHLDGMTAFGPQGPLRGQFPGSLTRWMLLPWQIDTGGCLAGYEDRLAADAPSFWPARVPNNVLAHASYLKVVDAASPRDERVDALARRRSWFHPLGGPSFEAGEKLVQQFGAMGVIEAYPGVADDPDFPPVIYAETHPATKNKPATAGPPIPASAAPPSPADLRAQAAGFASEAVRTAARRMRFGR